MAGGGTGRTRGQDRLSAIELIDAVVDPGSWRSWDEAVVLPRGIDPGYAADLARARSGPGWTRPSSPGRATCAVARWRSSSPSSGSSPARSASPPASGSSARSSGPPRERLPLVAAPASGGTPPAGRHGGVPADGPGGGGADHRSAGLPYLVYLRHPTTGGVLASGVARSRDRRRAGGLIGLRAAGLRGPARPAVPAGRPGRREPLRQRPGRRGGGAQWGRRGGRPRPGGAVRPPRAPPGPRAARRRPRRGDPGRRVDPALPAPRPSGCGPCSRWPRRR